MLRITEQTSGAELVLRLEGGLAGPWVQELEACWRAAAARPGQQLRVDLRSVGQIDAAGRDLLTAMYRAGARFVASGCVMPEIVREISTCPLAGYLPDAPRRTRETHDQLPAAGGHTAAATGTSRRS